MKEGRECLIRGKMLRRNIPHLAETCTVCAFHEPPRIARIYFGLAIPKTGSQTFLRCKRIILLTEAKQVVVASCPSVLW